MAVFVELTDTEGRSHRINPNYVPHILPSQFKPGEPITGCRLWLDSGAWTGSRALDIPVLADEVADLLGSNIFRALTDADGKMHQLNPEYVTWIEPYDDKPGCRVWVDSGAHDGKLALNIPLPIDEITATLERA